MLAISLQAQPPSKFYQKFGGTGVDIGYGIRETFNRQYIICGSTSSYGYGSEDAFLQLIDSMGQNIWSKNYGGVMTDVAKNLIINPADSGFIFTGNTNSIGNGGYDVFVVRTDKNGNMIWQKSFGGFDWDFGNDIAFAPDGNIVVCGYSYNSKYGKSDGILMKINTSTGTQIWQKNYGGIEDDDFRAIKLTPDNFFILTGKTNSYNDIQGDIYFFKTNLNGDSVLFKTYGLVNKVDYGNDILKDYTNDYLIGGGSESYSFGMKDAFILKIDSVGNFIWVNNFGKADLDEEVSKVNLVYNYQGRYTISYSEIDLPSFKRDPKNLVLALNGFYMFGTSFGESEDEELFGTTNTSDKGYIGVGYTKSYGAILEDIYVIKYDSMFNFGGELIGIKENYFKPNSLKVYPTIVTNDNPFITIESDKEITYSLFDIYSRELYTSGKPDKNFTLKTSIDFQEMNIGLYILRINREGKDFQYKVIKD